MAYRGTLNVVDVSGAPMPHVDSKKGIAIIYERNCHNQ